MAEKRIEIKERNTSNTGWDTIYPKTIADIVMTSDGGNVESKISTLNAEVSGVGSKIDSVKSDTTAINTKTTDIQNKVQQILDKPSSGGGKSNGVPFGVTGYKYLNPYSSSSPFEIINIEGKGVLRHLYVHQGNNISSYVKCIVDGVTIMEFYKSDGAGYFNTNLIEFDPANNSFIALGTLSDHNIDLVYQSFSIGQILFSDSFSRGSTYEDKIIIGDGIGFENSLRIIGYGSSAYSSYFAFGELL